MPSNLGSPAAMVRILGDLKVEVAGEERAVPRGLSSRLLLALSFAGGATLSDVELIDRLWDHPPENARYSLRNTVARLRRLIGDEAIERRRTGYRLAMDHCSVDVVELRRTVGEARALAEGGQAAAAADQLGRALASIDGTSIDEIAGEEWTRPLLRRMREEILVIEEEWADFAIAAGPSPTDVLRMDEAARQAPLRERRWVHLIDALRLTGRRAEALRAMESAQAALREVGFTPSSELEAAERRALEEGVPADESQPSTRADLIAELRVSGDDDLLLLDCLLSELDSGSEGADDLDELAEGVLNSLLDAGEAADAERVGRRWLSLRLPAGQGAAALRVQIHLAAAMLANDHGAEGAVLLDLVGERARTTGQAEIEAEALLARGPIDTASPDATRIADRAEAVLTRLDGEKIELRVQLATWAAHHRAMLGDRAGAGSLLDAVSASSLQVDDPRMRSLVLAVDAQLELLVEGSPGSFRGKLVELEAWADLTGDLSASAAAALFSASAAGIERSTSDMERAADRLRLANRRLCRADLRWMDDCLTAAKAIMQGDDATSLIDAAAATGLELGAAGSQPAAMVQRTVVMWLSGELAPMAPLLRPDPGARPEVVAVWGLAAAAAGDSSAIGEAAVRLGEDERPLRSAGVSWPLVAQACAEVAAKSGDADLAERCFGDLASWSGAGLTLLGTCYLGTADGPLGMLAAAMGERSTAAHLLDRALEQERAAGATHFAERIERWVRWLGESG